MTKFQKNAKRQIRTKADICSDFVNYLINEGIATIEDKDTLIEDEEGTLEFLHDLLYETEEIQGVLCSTPRAWRIWVDIVLRYEPKKGLKIWNKFVEKVFVDIEQHRYCCILASRGLGKSYVGYGLYSLFKMYLYEHTNIIIASNIPRMCKRNLREASKPLIDTNELLLSKKDVNKGKELIWTQDALEFNGGILETISLGSNPRSAHNHYVFIDDLLRDDNTYSDEEIHNFIFGQLFPIAQRHKARIIVTGTPNHIKDIYHYIMNTKADFGGEMIHHGGFGHNGFWCNKYSIITDWERHEILLPELFTWWDLADEKNPQSLIRTQGETAFMKEYMLICTDETTTLFPEKLIQACVDTNYKFIYRADGQLKSYIMGVDVATAGEASSDYSAFVVLEIFETQNGMKKIIRHITHQKGMAITGEKDKYGELLDPSLPGQVDTIEMLSRVFNEARVVVEKNNVGVALIQELQKRNVNVEEFLTTARSKDDILRYLINEMKSGNIIIPDETAEIRALKREMINFGVYRTRKGNEKMGALSGHDDMVMALAIANKIAQSIGGSGLAICQD